MARAIWTGVVSFGLVSVPVGLYSATEDHTVHFHQLQRGTADRIRNRRVNERTGDEVGTSDIVKGYEVGEGEYVVVEPEELDEIAPGRSQTIDITDFVASRRSSRSTSTAPTTSPRAARSTPRSTSCCGRHWRSRTGSASQRS
jgi:Ku protein